MQARLALPARPGRLAPAAAAQHEGKVPTGMHPHDLCSRWCELLTCITLYDCRLHDCSLHNHVHMLLAPGCPATLAQCKNLARVIHAEATASPSSWCWHCCARRQCWNGTASVTTSCACSCTTRPHVRTCCPVCALFEPVCASRHCSHLVLS